jgi:hypothetical protein
MANSQQMDGSSDMNTLLNNSLKAFACGAAALAITAVMSASFVQSTSVVRNETYNPTPWTAKLTARPVHSWFGQPEPAVLVD